MNAIPVCPRALTWGYRPPLAVTLTLAAILAGAPATFGLGFRIPNQDAEAVARGNAFVATADNPAAIYYNPAGITQLEGQNFQVGVLNYLGINTRYEAPGGGHLNNDFEVLPIPQFHYVFSPTNSPLSFGLGAYAPFGLGVEWSEDSGFRSLAIESRLQYITLEPVVAWQIHPQLSLAIGPTINFSEVKFNRGLATPLDVFEFKGRGIGYGFNAGLRWQPHPQWSFGAIYRSATTVNYEGHTRYEPGIEVPAVKTRGEIDYPQIVTAGVSFRPTSKWNIEVDVDWANWSTLDRVVLEGTRDIFGADLPLELGWHDSWFYEIGATRYLGNGWFVSVGYFFSGDTASERNYTPAIPDTDLHVGSVGFGFKGASWHWALAGQIITGPEREIEKSVPNPFTGESGNGSYQLTVPAVSCSVGYRF